MKCQAVKNRMLLFLGGELPTEQASAIQNHLDVCPICAAYAAQCEASLDQLENALRSESSAPPTLDARVMATIRRLPARRNSWPAFAPPWSRAPRFQLAFSVACALFLGYFLGANAIFAPPTRVVSTDVSTHNVLPPVELVSAYGLMRGHVMVEGNTTESVAAKLKKIAPPNANTQLKLVALRDADAKLLGGCWMNIGGRAAASFCYEWNGRRVSVFQAALRGDESGFQVEQRDGISVSLWRESGKVFALVVEAAPEDALKLSREISLT
jgi:anti-sigma factor RsiW